MSKLKDGDILNWGKEHKGKALINVPAAYLVWMHDDAQHVPHDLREYLRENIEVLRIQKKKEGNFKR